MVCDKSEVQAERPNGYAWYGLGVLVLVYMLNFIDRQILSILANDIKADLNLGDDELGFLYGTAFTIMFTVLPRLGVVGNSPIMNVEPVFALVLAWAILGQAIAPMQVLGGLIVVAAATWLGLRRR